jgi:hypothetical protein
MGFLGLIGERFGKEIEIVCVSEDVNWVQSTVQENEEGKRKRTIISSLFSQFIIEVGKC